MSLSSAGKHGSNTVWTRFKHGSDRGSRHTTRRWRNSYENVIIFGWQTWFKHEFTPHYQKLTKLLRKCHNLLLVDMVQTRFKHGSVMVETWFRHEFAPHYQRLTIQLRKYHLLLADTVQVWCRHGSSMVQTGVPPHYHAEADMTLLRKCRCLLNGVWVHCRCWHLLHGVWVHMWVYTTLQMLTQSRECRYLLHGVWVYMWVYTTL